MSTYEPCPKEVIELANEIMCEFENHKPLLDAKVKIDFVFALSGVNEDGEPTGDAIRFHGCKALALARKIGLKDRTMGRGDAEILIDKDYFEDVTLPQKKALLDHEITHLVIRTDEDGAFLYDQLGRPRLSIKPHDYEFGFFKIVAERYGKNSLEVTQCKAMWDSGGQVLFPFVWKELQPA